MNSSAFPAGAQLGGCVRAAFVCQALQGSGRTQASLPLHWSLHVCFWQICATNILEITILRISDLKFARLVQGTSKYSLSNSTDYLHFVDGFIFCIYIYIFFLVFLCFKLKTSFCPRYLCFWRTRTFYVATEWIMSKIKKFNDSILYRPSSNFVSFPSNVFHSSFFLVQHLTQNH